jgi:hypothetical protein
LLNSSHAKYLVIGGYAVNHYGYNRPTGDLDIWVGHEPENANKVSEAVREFGFADLDAKVFAQPNKVVRMGVPPIRLEIMTTISGVEFDACHARRQTIHFDDVDVPVIGLDDLKQNKRAVGRHKDLADLEELS